MEKKDPKNTRVYSVHVSTLCTRATVNCIPIIRLMGSGSYYVFVLDMPNESALGGFDAL